MLHQSNLVLAGMFLLLIGCSSPRQNEQKVQTVEQESDRDGATIPASGCYMYATDRDTVYLVFDPPHGDTITGELRYDFFERDGNVGFIEGTRRGDTLIADYTFLSEGMISVREVGFLLADDQVIEGYGEVDEVDGKMVFWHKNSLDFSKGLIMPRIPCEALDKPDYSHFFPDSIIQRRQQLLNQLQ
ncbi:MAG TPA: hypothetical protein VK014_11810 [Cyclobacteriaceae bacterium]|nr:hypothetical protein [Cyclobacteriaceae bacterium]